jgi:ABC-type transport system involved in cytochrome c biogenesis permease subunit
VFALFEPKVAGAESAVVLAEAGAAFAFAAGTAGAFWLGLLLVVSDVLQAIEKIAADEMSNAVLRTLIESPFD